jgi:hypothetical protein
MQNPNSIGIAPGVWIVPPPFAYLNHSCGPNSALGKRGELRALSLIEAGEEVTFDYSTTECDRFWRMTCGCGHPKCRKFLLPIQSTFLDSSTPPVAPPGMLRALRNARPGGGASS